MVSLEAVVLRLRLVGDGPGFLLELVCRVRLINFAEPAGEDGYLLELWYLLLPLLPVVMSRRP